MKEVSVTINGRSVRTTDDKTILQAVHENKIDHIPTLCNDDRIEPYGSCFVCVVEVEGVNRLLPSCATKVTDGMKVTTNSKRVIASRKTALELLMSNHYADCIGPCVNNCPAHVDAQGYIALISEGKHEEALKLIKENNPLPLSIGRVCVRDCEVVCRRDIVDETVGINYLKRYVADIDMAHMWTPEIAGDKDKKVAVVGGGPSGLSCAYYLRIKGYQVTILDQLPELGGMLRYGIPEYRLPKEVLDTEINWITGLGIEVRTGVEMGKDFTADSLMADGFDAIYIAVGAQGASSMRMEHENETEGVFRGIDFLKNIQLDEKAVLKGTVGIVGGGNTAIDAARTALRCGAEKVMILYRRSEKEMPAHEAEIEAAKEEGIEIKILTLPTKLIREGNRLKGVECIRMELKEAAPGDRPRPVPVEGSEYPIELDYLIGAIGQNVDISFNRSDNELELEKWGTIIVNGKTMETSRKKIFAGGDAVTGPFTAISSIADGKRASAAIDKFLELGTAIGAPDKFFSFKHRFNDIPKQELYFAADVKKEKMKELEPSERIRCFDEVELGFTGEQAVNEVKRCLECGCAEYYNCDLRKYCDEYGINIDDYLGEVRKYKVETDHPFITIDSNKCINCGKCVRTCAEILQVSALGFVRRGFQTIVKPAMEKPLNETNCISCGNCIDVCPTGALSEKYIFKVLGNLPKRDHEAICNFCSVGCRINFKVIDQDLFYVSNAPGSVQGPPNDGYLCVKGKFGHRYLLSGERLTAPVIKNGAATRKTGWEEALDHTADALKKIIEKYGSDSVAVFGSPKLSNEELYLLSKFARKSLGTNNVASISDLVYGRELNSLDHSFGLTASTAGIDDIDKSDILVLVNSGLSSENLIIEQKIKTAQKKGAKIVLVQSSEIKLTKFADLWVDSRKGTNTVLLNGMIRELIMSKKFGENPSDPAELDQLTGMVSGFNREKVVSLTGVSLDKYEKLLDMVLDPEKKVMFITSIDSGKDKSANDIRAMGNIQILSGRVSSEGNGIFIVRDYSNSMGTADMGLSPFYLPGQIKYSETSAIKSLGKKWGTDLTKIFVPSDLRNRMASGEIRAAVIFGENPFIENEGLKLFSSLEFLAVNQLFYDQTSKEADVILPASSFIEQTGTYTSSDTRVQRSGRMLESPTGMENWQVIAGLASRFGREGFEFASTDVIFNEIKEVNRLYADAGDGACWKTSWITGGLKDLEIRPKLSIYPTVTDTYPYKKDSMLWSEDFFSSKIRNMLKKY